MMKNSTEFQSLSSGNLQKIDFFNGLPRAIVGNLLHNAITEKFNPKEVVFHQGEMADFFVLIVDGFFKLSRESGDGNKKFILDFVCAGDMVAGLLMVEEHATFLGTLKALEPGHALKIPRQTYINYWATTPEAIRRLQLANLKRMRSLQDLREANSFTLEKRMAYTAINYLIKIGNVDGLIPVKFSRIELSELLNTTPESVIRVMSQWKKDNLLIFKNGLEFLDSAKLKEKYFTPAKSIFGVD